MHFVRLAAWALPTGSELERLFASNSLDWSALNGNVKYYLLHNARIIGISLASCTGLQREWSMVGVFKNDGF